LFTQREAIVSPGKIVLVIRQRGLRRISQVLQSKRYRCFLHVALNMLLLPVICSAAGEHVPPWGHKNVVDKDETCMLLVMLAVQTLSTTF